MGILEFFTSLIKNEITSTAIIIDYKTKSEINHLLMDFNSIIHVSSQKIIGEVNKFLELILKHIYQQIPLDHKIILDNLEKYNMDKKKITLQSSPDDIIKLFHEHFNEKVMDKLIITLVIKNVLEIIRTYCDNKAIKTLFLAIDGVPSKSKLLEQRQRRYMGQITELYKKKILYQYKDYLSEQPDFIYLAIRHSIQWSRGNITPGTAFMDKFVRYLNSDQVQNKLKTNRSQMKIIISDMYEIGEGEKKIVNYVNQYLNNTEDKIVIYSPDADMILLCILLPAKHIYMLRYNQQTFLFDLIDIWMLKTNISYYINNNPKFSKENFSVDRINYDLVCINSLFGNDFIPKIETINVKRGFQNILDAYLQTLIEFKQKNLYLVETNKKQFKLNFIFLKYIFKFLVPLENDFITYNHLYNKYINIGHIKNVFDYLEVNEENLVAIYQQFRTEYEELKHVIRTHGNYGYFIKHDQFMSSLKKCLNINMDGTSITISFLSNNEVIKLLKNYFHKYKNFPKLNINLNTYSRHSDDPHFKNETQGMNKYQKELFKFEKMLDYYQEKFNAQPLNLSKNKINSYYQTYFGTQLFKDGQLTMEANNIMRDYLEGLIWVFNYYLNDPAYISHWYYIYEKAPLLQHLFMFCNKINQQYFDDIFNNLPKYHIQKLENYFNPIEQLIYVSPLTTSTLARLPSNYKKYLLSADLDPFLKHYFVDIKLVTDKLWNEKVGTDIDCHGNIYFTKCIIKTIHKPTDDDDKLFLKSIRKVKPDKISIRRSKNMEPAF